MGSEAVGLLPPGHLGLLGVQGAFCVAPRTVSSSGGGGENGAEGCGQERKLHRPDCNKRPGGGSRCCEGRGPSAPTARATALPSPAESLKRSRQLVTVWSRGTSPRRAPQPVVPAKGSKLAKLHSVHSGPIPIPCVGADSETGMLCRVTP